MVMHSFNAYYQLKHKKSATTIFIILIAAYCTFEFISFVCVLIMWNINSRVVVLTIFFWAATVVNTIKKLDN